MSISRSEAQGRTQSQHIVAQIDARYDMRAVCVSPGWFACMLPPLVSRHQDDGCEALTSPSVETLAEM